jgi:hypothetical protein
MEVKAERKVAPKLLEVFRPDNIGAVWRLPVADRFLRAKRINRGFPLLIPNFFEPPADQL